MPYTKWSFALGHLRFDVSGDKHSDTDNQKPSNVARPELLRLSRAIYQKYHVRMWQENRCVVKIGSGNMRSIELVKGHVGAPFAYLDSIGEDQDTIKDIRYYRLLFDPDPSGPSLSEPSTVSMYPLSTENPPGSWIVWHQRAGVQIANDVEWFEAAGIGPESFSGHFLLLNSYGPSGEWTGRELSAHNRDGEWPKGTSRSIENMWKAIVINDWEDEGLS